MSDDVERLQQQLSNAMSQIATLNNQLLYAQAAKQSATQRARSAELQVSNMQIERAKAMQAVAMLQAQLGDALVAISGVYVQSSDIG